jgi:hypothetical protein
MNNLKSTIGFVGPEGVKLKDPSVFKNGEVVIVLSAENFDDFFNQLNAVKENLKKSEEWIDEIKKIKENNF